MLSSSPRIAFGEVTYVVVVGRYTKKPLGCRRRNEQLATISHKLKDLRKIEDYETSKLLLFLLTFDISDCSYVVLHGEHKLVVEDPLGLNIFDTHLVSRTLKMTNLQKDKIFNASG